jgi:hypothetical protein
MGFEIGDVVTATWGGHKRILTVTDLIDQYLVLHPNQMWIDEARKAQGNVPMYYNMMSACQMETIEKMEQAKIPLPSPDSDEWANFTQEILRKIDEKLLAEAAKQYPASEVEEWASNNPDYQEWATKEWWKV